MTRRRNERPAGAAFALAILTTLAVGAVSPSPAAAPALLRLEEFRTAVSISDPQISPGGRGVAFVTRVADYDTNKYVTTVRVVDVRTGTITTVSRPSDSASAPRWSPDGLQLAFLAKPKKADAAPGSPEPNVSPSASATATATDSDDAAYDAPQIAVLSSSSFTPVFVTHEPRGVKSFAWQPDGRGFAFLETDEAPNKKAIDAHDDAFEVGDNQWNLKAAPLPSHLWTIPIGGGRAHRVTSGTFSLEGEPRFTHDGRAVLLQRYPTAFTQHYASSRLVRIGLRDGAISTVVAGAPAEGRFSRDGARLAYASENPASFSISDVFSAGANGGSPVDVTRRFDRAAEDFAFDQDDRSLIVEVHDGTRSRLVRFGPGKPRPINLGSGNPGAFDVDRSGLIAFVAAAPRAAQELYLAYPDGIVRRLTQYNAALTAHTLARVRAVAWKTRDGVLADGVVTAPAGLPRGTRAPLVLVIHGGPTSASLETFSELSQLLAARGFFVFEPNYRGSDNLGAAFAQETVPHITSVPGNDVEDGLAVVLKSFPIDPARIGVSGWSEGGLLTSWLITHDTRWKAAMSGAAVNDWLMYRDLTDAQDFAPRFISATSPWTDDQVRDLYRAESPLTYAANVKTPTLIMTDAGDQRVPTPLAYAFFHAIRATGTPVTMIVEPTDGHFPSDPVRSEDVLRRWVGWFAEKL
jgi:dipeptidyl aminopeptidase/acylaminoacyl peptidase